jgi:hypothetical protein
VAVGGRIEWDQAALRQLLTSPDGDVARDLRRRAENVTQGAKRRAPVSPAGSHGRPSGYGRSQIGWEMGVDAEGLYADISTPALSPEGFPYMGLQEVGGRFIPAQPHLRPALFEDGAQ